VKPSRIISVGEKELAEAFSFYMAESPRAAEFFLLAVTRAIREIEQFPSQGRVVHGLTRQKRLKHFPYALLYRDDPTEVVITAVRHLSRHPNHWKDRL